MAKENPTTNVEESQKVILREDALGFLIARINQLNDAINSLRSDFGTLSTQINSTLNAANAVYALAEAVEKTADEANNNSASAQANLTSFINDADKTYAPINSPTLTGTPKTATVGNNPDQAQIPTVKYVNDSVTSAFNSIQTFSTDKAGFVPAASKGTTLRVLTVSGWLSLADVAKA